MKRLLCFLWILTPLLLCSQVINTERLRINTKESGWHGSVDLSANLSRTTIKLSGIGLRTGLEYLKNKNRFLLVGNLNLARKDDSVHLSNDGYIHLRYGKNIGEKAIWEVFEQAQFHEFKNIGLRNLLGTGFRFKLVENDSARFYLGSIYMYEYEELYNNEVINRDHRLSLYISTAFRFNDRIFVDHITYYQPKIISPSDFRISSESILNISITQRFNFRLSFLYGYDSQPPAGIPRINYGLRQSIGVSF